MAAVQGRTKGAKWHGAGLLFAAGWLASCNSLLGIDEPFARGGAGPAQGGSGGIAGNGGLAGLLAGQGGAPPIAGDGRGRGDAGASAGGWSGEGGAAAGVSGQSAADSGAGGHGTGIGLAGAGGVRTSGGGAGGAGGQGGEGALAGHGGVGHCTDDGSTQVGAALVDAPSCSSATSCGDHDCCQRLPVEGGEFLLARTIPARVDTFYLDHHEVTVGRFRRFVAEYAGPPAPNEGAHPLIESSGWNPEWVLLLPEAGDIAAWNQRLRACQHATWTPAQGANERKPINCVNWYEAFAFCAWDGARLPTDAEWSYAASGGCGARRYPWGSAVATSDRATFLLHAIVDAGTKRAGTGRWGHQELAGSTAEWVLDFNEGPGSRANTFPFSECDNCANLVATPARTTRGGGFESDTHEITAESRRGLEPVLMRADTGFRCAVSR